MSAKLQRQLDEAWREIRILQLQMAMIVGRLHDSSRPGLSHMLSDRQTLEELERIDRRDEAR